MGNEMNDPVYMRDIEDARRRVHELEEAYLRRFGWEYTCDAPGSLWMWRRDFSDQDAGRLERWKSKGAIHRKPAPWGIAHLPHDTAVDITARTLDRRDEEADDEIEG